jgi:hypothetical protein
LFGHLSSRRTNFEATPPPILIDNGLAVLDNESIERHIMKNIPGGHNLFVQDIAVAKKIENVYNVRQNPQNLLPRNANKAVCLPRDCGYEDGRSLSSANIVMILIFEPHFYEAVRFTFGWSKTHENCRSVAR